jgi:hypothetical protein
MQYADLSVEYDRFMQHLPASELTPESRAALGIGKPPWILTRRPGFCHRILNSVAVAGKTSPPLAIVVIGRQCVATLTLAIVVIGR